MELPVKVAYVYTRRHNPPWLLGESVTAKNVVSALKEIYAEVHMVPHRERKDSEEGLPKFPDSADHHVMNYPYLAALKSAGLLRFSSKKHRFFFYRMMVYNRFYKLSSNIKSMLGSLLAISTSKLLTTSRILYDAFARTRKVTYLPMPVDPHFFSPSFHEVKRLHNHLLYIGQLNPIRFPMKDMIEVFKVISNVGGRMEIIAPCSVENRVYAEIIKKYCSRFGLQRHIKVRVCNLTMSEKIRAYRASNAFIFTPLTPCAVDPPMTIPEAMASGCVVISTDLLSLPYILGDERGILVRHKTLGSELKHAVSQVLSDKDFSNKIRENALAYVRSFHTIESARAIIHACIDSS